MEQSLLDLREELRGANARLAALEMRVAGIEASKTYKLSRAIRSIIPSRALDLGTIPARALMLLGSSILSRVSSTERKRWALAQKLNSFGSRNTQVQLEASAPKIVRVLNGLELQHALGMFDRREIASALAFVRTCASNARNLPQRALVHLARAEAVVRCAREGLALPPRTVLSTYSAAPTRIFYMVHMRPPFIQNGYTSRTDLILSALSRLGLEPIGITRLGFPNDLAALRQAEIAVEDFVGARFLALIDPEGGRVNRPIDELINAYADRVVELAMRECPAVLHAASNYINGLAAVHAGRRLGIPSIYEVRGFWHITRASHDHAYGDSEDYRLSERMELDAIREADRVISISSAIKQYLVDRNVAAEKIFVVPNGADVDSLKPLVRDHDLARDLGIQDESLVIGYVGSLVDYEGMDLLIEALAKLRSMFRQSVRLLIVGAGTAEASLNVLAKERGVEELCVFAGRVPKEDVRRYYSLIDIAPFPRKLLPVTSLVPPLKPLEAMAMGKPVLIANLPVLTELGSDRESVIHFAHDDADALAQALMSLIQSGELRERIGKAGRAWVTRERSLPAIEQLLREAYRF